MLAAIDHLVNTGHHGAMPGKKAPEAERQKQLLVAAFEVAASEGLDRLTSRKVAAAAGLSTGLVFFHFGNKEGLRLALLDWLLATTIVGEPGPDVLALPTARERLLGLLRQELVLLPERLPRVALFFDFWVAGTRQPEIRQRLELALAGYRAQFLPLAKDALATVEHADPEALAGLVVAVVQGGVVQAVADPDGFDVPRFLAAVEQVVGGGG